MLSNLDTLTDVTMCALFHLIKMATPSVGKN